MSEVLRMLRFSFGLSTLVFAIFIFCSQVIAIQENADKQSEAMIDKPTRREISATAFFDPAREIFYSNVTLDALPAGEKCRLLLTIENGLSSPLEMVSLNTSCSCSSAKFPEGTLESGKSITGEVLFDLPTSSVTGKFALSLEFRSDPLKSATATINISAPLMGSLEIDRFVNVFEISDRLSQWRIPVYFTPPISLASLAVEKSDELRDVEFSLASNEHGAWIEMSVADLLVGSRGVSGSFRMVDSVLGVSATRSIVLIRIPPVKLSPAVVRFRPMSPDDSDSLVANAMLQLVPQKSKRNHAVDSSDNSADSAVELVSVSLTICGKQMDVEATQLGTTGVFRLRVLASRGDLKVPGPDSAVKVGELDGDDLEPETVWVVRTSKATYTVPVSLFVD